jgi:hypothetical protein
MLNEMLSDKVFHFTTITNAEKILSSEKIRLTPSIGTGVEDQMKSGDRVYYLSLARSRTADYTVQSAYSQGVVFNINGQYFNQNHRSKAVDYWERMWMHRTKDGRTSEMEDRLYSTKPNINIDLKKAFSSIHILVKNDLSNMVYLAALKIVKIAKQNSIPVFIYSDSKDFVLQDTRKAIPVRELMDLYKGTEKVKPYTRHRSRYLDRWMELIFKKDRKELSKKARTMTWNMYGMYLEDMVRSLSADIHNYRRDDDYAGQIYKIVQYMKNNNLKNIKELVGHLSEKWSSK